MFHFTRLNPLLFFHTRKQIEEAQEKVFKYKSRLEAADNLGSQVMMKPEEIADVK